MSYNYKKKFPLKPTRKLLNNINQLEYTKADVLNIGENKNNVIKNRGIKKFDGSSDSDIFNLKKILNQSRGLIRLILQIFFLVLEMIINFLKI